MKFCHELRLILTVATFSLFISPRLQILTIIQPSDGREGIGREPNSID
jgi:hypothetical protein